VAPDIASDVEETHSESVPHFLSTRRNMAPQIARFESRHEGKNDIVENRKPEDGDNNNEGILTRFTITSPEIEDTIDDHHMRILPLPWKLISLRYHSSSIRRRSTLPNPKPYLDIFGGLGIEHQSTVLNLSDEIRYVILYDYLTSTLMISFTTPDARPRAPLA